ncbi:MAG TPA: hypothetical protein VHT34_03595, partial [Clostridia bacterium]|nr:hypothetical protein [Clostridia bacterium]
MSDTTNTTLYTPVLDWISYSSGILSASWTSAADESEYYFEVKLSNKSDDRDSRVCKVKGCTNCNWSLAEEKDFNINIDTTYTVKVIQTDQSYSQFGDWSNEITLINAGPGNVSVEYNGTELKVSWDAKVGTLPLHGGSVSIYDITKTDPLKTYPFDGSSSIIKPFPPLDSNLSYVITVAGMNPGSTGPASDPVDILQQPVQISKLQYTNNTLIATTNQVAVNPTTFTLFLYVDGQLTEQSPPQSGGSVFYTVENSLELCQYNEVRLAFTKGGSRGPLSKPVAAIPGVPVLHSVYYDGAKIKAIWSNPPGEPVPTEGSIELFDDTQNNGQIDNAPAIGNSGTLVPKVVIDPSKSYDLRVASVYGISIGTNSASLAVISSVKQISSVDYDNGKITVSWPQGQLYGATGYLLSLESNGSTIATQNAGDTKGCINYRLDPESEYNVLLQAIGNNTVGPSSNPAAVISAQVRVKQVTTQDNGAVYAELDNTVAPVGGSISGYMAILYKDEVPVEKPVAASGTPLSVEFSYTPQILDNCYVRAQAIGSNSTGPLSSPVDVILGVPVIESIKCSDATHAYIQWSAVQEKCVTGYMLTVENSTDPQTHFCSSPCYTIPVASWQNYSITVQAVGNKTKGKCSQTINFSTDVLDVTSIHYDGSSITAAWPDASISGSNYELLLSSNYSVFMTFPTITNPVVIPTLLSQGVPYSLQVRVVNGLFTGSPGSLVAVISDVPGIISITYDSFQVKVVIDDTNTKGKSGISLYKAFLYENGDLFEEFVTTPESPLSAVFNKPLKKNCSYSVTVQAIDTNCCFTGPECEAEPVISGVPVIDSIDNDGNNALISWSTVSGNAVTGYNVVLTDAEGNSYPTDTA